MSGIIGSVRSKSGTIDQLSSGTITTDVIQPPDFMFNIPMQDLAPATTFFSDNEVKMDCRTGYSGLRSDKQYRYFDVEYDIKGSSSPGSNHQGFFWGNTSTTTVQGGNSTGHRITHQNASNHFVRDSNSNSAVGSGWTDYNPSDNAFHHHKVLAHKNGTTYVYTDGTLRWSGAYQILGYVGLVGLAGYVHFKNIQFRGWTIN